MNNVIYSNFDKSLMDKMPVEAFEGRIFVIDTPNKIANAISYLSTQNALGVDTETRPSFKKGRVNKVALLQISTLDTCFLFRINRTDVTQDMVNLFENNSILKIGLSLKDDFQKLFDRQNFNPQGFIDLQTYVKEIGIQDNGLQKIYSNLFHKKISKRQQLSNWEADVLTERQKLYAATDAWACLKIYNEVNNLKEHNTFTLI